MRLRLALLVTALCCGGLLAAAAHAADPFGATDPGTDSGRPGAGYKFGTIYALTGDAKTATFSFFATGGDADQSFVPIVYGVGADGKPGSLVTTGSSVTVAAHQDAGWVTAALPTIGLAQGSYFLGLLSGPAPNSAAISFATVPGSGFWNVNDGSSATSTFGAANTSDQHLSVRADTTAADPLDGTCGAVVTTAAPFPFDGAVYTSGCGTVRAAPGGELEARIVGPFPGPSDDKAYASWDFSGPSGLAGTVGVHDEIRVDANAQPTGNMPVLQMLDVSGSLVWELYLDAQRVVHLWSPAGGLRATEINLSSGVAAPLTTDPVAPLELDVAARQNDSITVKVGRVTKIAIGFLSGAATGTQRTLRAGIIGYLAASGSAVAVYHSNVKAPVSGGATGCGGVDTTSTPPAGFDGVVFTDGCGSVLPAGGGFEARILGPFPGASDDKAYAYASFGGAAGVSGFVAAHDTIQVDPQSGPTGNLPVFQVYDVHDALVYELYLDAQRVIHVWSPPGGLRATEINASTGAVASLTPTHIDVTAQAGNRFTLSVDGSVKLSLTGLGGATTGNQRTVRAGIIGYGPGAQTDVVAVTHSGVAASAAVPDCTTPTTDTASPPPGFDSTTSTPTCGVVRTTNGALEARISGPFPGPTDNKAYGSKDFGGASGLAGLVAAHDAIQVDANAVPTGSVPVFQVYDVAGSLVYELYLDAARVIHLYSPPGGLRGSEINTTTGVTAPLTTDPGGPLGIDVSAERNNRIDVTIGGTDRISLTGLSGATSGNQRTLRAGIIGYAGTSGSAVDVLHSNVAAALATGLTGTCGAATASSAAPSGFDSVTITAGCGLVQTAASGALEARVNGPSGSVDTKAYATKDFGGASGLSGVVTVHDDLQLGGTAGPGGNLPILQVYDVNGLLVYELLLDSNRFLILHSPAGGLRGTELTQSVGTGPPWINESAPALGLDIAAQANNQIVIRNTGNGTQLLTLSGLSGATTGNQRTLRVGISGYAGSSDPSAALSVFHGNVSASTSVSGAPVNTAPPTFTGTLKEGQVLTASPGTWTSSPTSFSYLWTGCDNAPGAGCGLVIGTGPTLTLRAGAVGGVIQLIVTATNSSGSTSIDSAPSTDLVVPLGFDTVVASWDGALKKLANGELQAVIQGPFPDPQHDKVYAQQDFAGSAGSPGGSLAHDHLRVEQAPIANLPVFQMLDVNGSLVYELYLDSSRGLHLWSPAGGLRAAEINLPTGDTAPLATEATPALDIAVNSQRNDHITITVNGVQRISLTGLAGATTGNQRWFRAGIIGYGGGVDSSSVAVLHSGVYVGP